MSGQPSEFLAPLLPRRTVYYFIDTERTYQDYLGNDRTDGRKHGVSGYVIMFQEYLNQAYTAWTKYPGDEYALDIIRKLAGIAVHAMEDHGVVLREPFQS